MNIKSMFAGSAALAVLVLVAPPLLTGKGIIPAAQAATSVSFNVFFDTLAPHGDWVSYRDNYVFVPARLEPGWRPYTRGHWVYTEAYGWTWSSNEKFGWATYHYGRWGYGDDLGWYWVPGNRWAPAWVSWRRSNDHVVWAPLPPSHGDDVSINVSIGSIPDNYWVAVPTTSFLDLDLRIRIIDNDRERRRIVERAKPLGSVVIRNNVVVNNVIDVKIVERDTGKKVKRVKIRETDNPREARSDDNEVAVFDGRIERERDAKPKEVTRVEDVKRKRPRGQQADQPAASTEVSQPAGDGNIATETDSPVINKKDSERKATRKDEPTKKAVKLERIKKERVQKAADKKQIARQKLANKKLLKAQDGKTTEKAKAKVRKDKAKDGPTQADEKLRKKNAKKVKCDPLTDADCQT